MCCKSCWKKIVPFAVALTFGVLITSFFQKLTSSSESQTVPKYGSVFVTGSGGNSKCDVGGSGGGGIANDETSSTGTTALRIFSKPRPAYTEGARENSAQGTVRLRVTFLENGQIGSVSAVTVLPYGLTEQAIAAARSIKFVPETVDGKPVSVTKLIEYSFTIY